MVLLLFAGGSSYLYYNQDQLIEKIIAEINESIQTPVEVSSIDINLWTDFPNISLRFQDVLIKESIEGSSSPLARLKELTLSFNTLDFLKKDYSFEKIILKQGEIDFFRNIFGKRALIYSVGGHCGNMEHQKNVQQMIHFFKE